MTLPPSLSEVGALYQKLNKEAEASGYLLNPDMEFTKALCESLLINTARFGYPACPCRLATGKKEKDLDLICPCDYRDLDLAEHEACYCALYVSSKIKSGALQAKAIPERRPSETERLIKNSQEKAVANFASLSHPVWRCKVCGYLCARDEAPEICPICKATRERFERFI